jgi:MFS family permease
VLTNRDIRRLPSCGNRLHLVIHRRLRCRCRRRHLDLYVEQKLHQYCLMLIIVSSTDKAFEKNFGYTTKGESEVNSLTVGLEQLGSWVAAFLVYPITNRYGRKYVIMGSAVVFIIGIIIQTVDTHSLGAWYFARIVGGIGQGAMSVVIPMYSAEMTPKEIRGRCGSFYQWMYTWGMPFLTFRG